jgi:hypothetical protein
MLFLALLCATSPSAEALKQVGALVRYGKNIALCTLKKVKFKNLFVLLFIYKTP